MRHIFGNTAYRKRSEEQNETLWRATEAQVLDSTIQTTKGPSVTTDKSRDAKLTDFGKATLSDRYLLPGEDFQDLFARVASTYGDDDAHAGRA